MIRRVVLAVLFSLAAVFVAAAPTDAGGPGTGGRRVRLEDEPAGPYLVRVVTSPTPPRVENLYLEIRVEEAASGALVTDARVFAKAVFLDGAAPMVAAEATHDIAPNPVEYAAHLPVSQAGAWEIQVRIEGTPGSGQVRFEEQVSRPTSVSTILAIGIPVVGLAALGVVFLRLERQRRRAAPGESN